MDHKPPVKLNRFVLVAVILFNLIWLTLLFLSCQADNMPDPTATPEAGLSEPLGLVCQITTSRRTIHHPLAASLL